MLYFVFSKCFILWHKTMALFVPKHVAICHYTNDSVVLWSKVVLFLPSRRFRLGMVICRRWKREGRMVCWLTGIVFEYLYIVSNSNWYNRKLAINSICKIKFKFIWDEIGVEIQSVFYNSNLYTKKLARNSICSI